MSSLVEFYIKELNKEITNIVSNYFNSNSIVCYGLAKLINKSNEYVPTIYEGNKIVDVLFNDKKDVSIYHRLIDTKVLEYRNNKAFCENRIKMIVYTKLDRYDLVEFFLKYIPENMLVSNSIFSTNINQVSFNENDIFRRERGNIEYNLNKTWHLIDFDIVSRHSLSYCIDKICK